MKRKVIDRSQLASLIKGLRGKGKTIVFTNGCFDLLHVGHVRYLTEAASLGDCLVVGLNSDRSVRSIKDPNRPLIDQEQRAEVLSALECVDYIVLFDEPDPYSLIEAIRPDILVKGADWSLDKIIGADLVTGYGGEVRRVTLVPATSTTDIINRILDRYGKRDKRTF
jgi:rfaE bifunctional protein nucleotidyltransferase chain/domain